MADAFFFQIIPKLTQIPYGKIAGNFHEKTTGKKPTD
jgi:hypothetical protein